MSDKNLSYVIHLETENHELRTQIEDLVSSKQTLVSDLIKFETQIFNLMEGESVFKECITSQRNEIERIKALLECTEENLNTYQIDFTEAAAENQKLKDVIAAFEQNYNQLKAENDVLRKGCTLKDYIELQDVIAALRIENEQLKSELITEKNANQLLQNDINFLNEKLKNSTGVLSYQWRDLLVENEELKNLVAHTQKNFDGLLEQNELLTEAYNKCSSENFELNMQVECLKTEIEDNRLERDEHLTQLDAQHGQILKLESTNQKLRTVIDQKESEIKRQEAQHIDDLDYKEKKLSTLIKEVDMLAAALKETGEQYAALNRRATRDAERFDAFVKITNKLIEATL